MANLARNLDIYQNSPTLDERHATSGEAQGATTVASYKIIRRNGSVVSFDKGKISLAITRAFLAVRGQTAADSAGIRTIIEETTEQVVQALLRRKKWVATFHIEDVQDQVELALMRGEHHDVARAYVLYREQRAAARREKTEALAPQKITYIAADGNKKQLDMQAVANRIYAACAGLTEVDPEKLLKMTLRDIYDGISEKDINTSFFMVARSFIEREPQYSQVSARLLLEMLRWEIFGDYLQGAQMENIYPSHLQSMVQKGVAAGLLNPALLQKFDLAALGRVLEASRDLQFNYLGLQTLYDRYFLHINGQRIEMPQSFFMRVAMGLALADDNPTARAIEFYHLLSSFRFMSSTPTLFNSGTMRSQLSSCYLTTVPDDLDGIFGAYKENALLAKFAGGLGNDWTPVRAMGSHICGTNGKSQGVIPFLKLVNDTAVAVNQGGKRKGAVCAYLESWHLDILDFLDLRKNSGDDRRRTHDMNTANWIPDLLMKRVMHNQNWTLFSPDEVPDLHGLYGSEFEQRYTEYEEAAAAGEIFAKTIEAVTLWRRMLTMLFETGHPWITFKDACNVRSPQQHVGVVHSSNLCTEITLNTNAEEIAVCNLGSVNLVAHITDGHLDTAALSATIKTAMRMLDNVIDINYYSVDKAKTSNLRHRPVGLGIMGFQDCLYEMNIAYNSPQAVAFADESMERICYEAYWASTELAEERGHYATFKGSLWDKGILPPDTLRLLAQSRGDSVDLSGELVPAQEALDGDYLKIDMTQRLDWAALRARIAQFGMRNSNCVAIAPTATIANIVGVTASIEPTFQNIYTKSNLSGEFVVSNRYLVQDLKQLELWDDVMLEDIKFFDGRLDKIDRIPANIRQKYPTAFEIEPTWLIECAARRQKWIDQAQSLNLYIKAPSGKTLDLMYKTAWLSGLKTTYYLRSLAASSTEKYTAPAGAHNSVPVNGGEMATAATEHGSNGASNGTTNGAVNGAGNGSGGELSRLACAIDDPDCESCQ